MYMILNVRKMFGKDRRKTSLFVKLPQSTTINLSLIVEKQSEAFCKKVVIRNFAKLAGKHLSCNFINNRL